MENVEDQNSLIFHLTELGKLNDIKSIVRNDPAIVTSPNKVFAINIETCSCVNMLQMGSTVLHIAAWRGHLECCKYFVENGALIHAINDVRYVIFIY